MTNIILHGCCGRMGRAVAAAAAGRDDCKIVAGVDIAGTAQGDFPVYKNLSDIPEDIKGVIIDFSTASAVRSVVDFALARKLPLVVATTGVSPEDEKYITESGSQIPVMHSANMSLGVCLIRALAKKAAAFLGTDYDIEIVERHHNRKLDAPSGTALAIADSINEAADGRYEYVYERQSRHESRHKDEIGISAVRGGNIVGDHEIIFAGNNEVIEIRHSALSRELFADGALRAALFLSGKAPGKYEISDMITL